MRKIETEEQKKTRENRRKLILGSIMILILVLSTAGYAFFGYGTTQESNSAYNGQYWVLNKEGRTLYLLTEPAMLNTSVSLNSNINAYSDIVYIDVNNSFIGSHLLGNLAPYLTLREACYGPCERNLPEKDCNSDIIVWKESNINRVYQQNRCIFIEGDISAVDAFLYKFFGN